MSLILFLILLVIVGLVVGALARLLLPGPDPMGAGATILLGLAGSFIAGLFSWYVLNRHGAGLILSVLFSMLLLWLRRRYGMSRGAVGTPAGRRP
ncbi:MAG: GlsB/YeaQ/YmgE family stress response membrane protein [Solirubrobacterales bacterium]|nr:GlsB/YeaQ/YmgE family stress response membrane protein [Solirubrobacterales bacterium]